MLTSDEKAPVSIFHQAAATRIYDVRYLISSSNSNICAVSNEGASPAFGRSCNGDINEESDAGDGAVSSSC